MEPTPDRRNERSERVPLQVPVELGHGDFHDPFEADARNLSKGGISMRAACLPDLGSRLLCRFQSLPSGTAVTAQGEVVWAHLDGERSGEFGLAFVDLDSKTEWLIEEMIAEHAAHGSGGGDGEGEGGAELHEAPGAPVATLELEGSPAAIAARLTSTEQGRAVFEQQLDLLRLGRGVHAHAPGADGRGHISKVELRMVGSVPMLAVTVEFAAAEPALEAAPASAEYPRDTEPDLMAPELPVEHEAQRAAEPDADLAAFDALVSEPHTPPTPPTALPTKLTPIPALPPTPAPALAPAPAPAPAPALATRATPHPDREFSASFKLPARNLDSDLEHDFELEALTTPAWQPALSRAWRLFCHAMLVLGDRAGVVLGASYRRALPQVRGALLRATTLARGVYVKQLAPQLGALRRLLAAQLGARRRRKTSAPGQVPARAASGSLGRTLLLGLLGAGAVGFAVYALVPAAGDDIELHRAVQPNAAAAVGLAPAPGAEPQAPSAASAAQPGTPPASPDPAVVPSAKQVPANSPFAVDVRSSSAPSQPSAGKLRFGATQVPNARRFALRMSNKVKSVQGVADAGGFTVTLMGSLSLDRAGPISAAHKAVQRAMVINKGDRAELSIRFAEGKRPAYQVSAEGNTVYVLLSDG